MKRKLMNFKESGLFVLIVMLLCTVLGITDASAMAATAPSGAATDQPDDAISQLSDQGEWTTLKEAMDQNPVLCRKTIHDEVVKIFPYSFPAQTVMRSNVKYKKNTNNHIIKVYSGEAFPIAIKVGVAYTASAVDEAVVDFGTDNKYIAINQNIYFPTIPGYKSDGTTIDGQCFVAVVVGKDASKKPILAARNGKASGAVANSIPSLALNTPAVRGVRTGTETQIRTDPFDMLPSNKEYYVQKNIMEIGESSWFRNADKEVKWNRSDKMEFALYEQKRTLNVDFWLGKGGSKLISNKYNDNKEELAFFMEGVWYQAGAEYSFAGLTIDTAKLIDFMKEIFNGNASSNTKTMFAGRDVVAAMQKVQFNQVVYPGDAWTDKELKLTFSSIMYFGGKKLLFTHDPSLDDLGMSDCALIMDDKFAVEYNYGYKTIEIDNEKMAISDTKGEAIVEENTYILLNQPAHWRVKLS